MFLLIIFRHYRERPPPVKPQRCAADRLQRTEEGGLPNPGQGYGAQGVQAQIRTGETQLPAL